LKYRGILYNKLLIAIRDTVLEQGEVTFLQSRYMKIEEHQNSDAVVGEEGGEYD